MAWPRNATSALAGASAVAIVLALMVLAARTIVAQAPAKDACSLLTAAELETAVGTKVTPAPLGDGCMARTPTGMVSMNIRATKTGPEAEAELAAAAAKAKQKGVLMDVKKFGSIYCTIMTPMKDVKAPFLTSCSVVKGSRAAAVEVTANSQKDMVPVEKLRTLAEKMATRF